MAKRKKSSIKGAPAWLVTMGDMNNLLMCFFIVMMGDVTVISEENFQMMVSSFKGSLGMMEGGSSLSKGKLMELGHNMTSLPSSEKARALSRSLRKALELFKPEIQSKYVRVREDERGLIITLSGDAYFDTGSARLKDEIKPVLKKVASIAKNIPNFMRIEGHTDDRRIPPAGIKEGYETNWDLSSMRSINVLRYLSEEEGIIPKRLSSVAFGEFRPIDDNNTPEGRAYNRRVDIVILRDRGPEESTSKEYSRPLPDEEWR